MIGLTVLRSPGADDIDLTNAIVEVFAKGESETLTSELEDGDNIESAVDDYDDGNDDLGSGDIASGEFRLVNLQDAGDATLSDSGDRAELFFELDNVGDGAALTPGDSVSVTITTASGGTAFVEKRAPSSITDGETYRL